MQFRRLFRSSILAVIMILAAAFIANPVMADPVVFQVATLTGTVDPITYTTAAGTFTTGTIMLTLSNSSTSFFTVDEASGAITSHLVIDATFNDGMGNNLMGTITIDEIGVLGPAPIFMEIQHGTLLGAGMFDGTNIFGTNPLTGLLPNFECRWVLPEDPDRRRISINLPPDFINGTNVPTNGRIQGTIVPEPASLILLGTGLAGIGGAVRRRRRRR